MLSARAPAAVPLWNPHVMGGRPFLANAQSAVEERRNALDTLLGSRDAGLPPVLLSLAVTVGSRVPGFVTQCPNFILSVFTASSVRSG